MRSNPFAPIVKPDDLPERTYVDYSANDGDFIVEYAEVDVVKKVGPKDTDFIVEKQVREVNRIPRQEYINSFRNDVGILNIIEKVRLSGDVTLLNQSGRVGYGSSGEVDSLGRDLEPVVDVCDYQVDPVEGIEKIKQAHDIPGNLDPDLKKGLSFEGLANLSDEQINAYLENKKQELLAAREAAKGENNG